MSIFKPTMSVTKYATSELPDIEEMEELDYLADKFTSFQIKEMYPGEELTYGWTSLMDPYTPKFNDMSFQVAEFVGVSIAINRKTIPGATLKRELHLMVENRKNELQIPKISRSMKAELKEIVIKNLLAQMPVVPASVDLIWNIPTRTAYLFSTQGLARNIFENLMLETFGVQVTMKFPYMIAVDVDVVPEGDLLKLVQTNFA